MRITKAATTYAFEGTRISKPVPKPFCQHYEKCGGCTQQHLDIAEYEANKHLILIKMAERLNMNTDTGNKNLTNVQLKHIACSLKLRDKKNDGKHNTQYCCYDAKTRRFFYRNAFLKLIENKIKTGKADIQKWLQEA